MKENSNIDELLNSFIDDELSPRHRTEVQRLAAHNAEVAERLAELERCKMLVGSLPRAEAPVEMAEDIKAALERRTLLGQRPEHIESQRGVMQLFVRKVTTAAAMIGLVAVLGAVIYSILAPEGAPYEPVAVEPEPLQPAPAIMAVSDEKPVVEVDAAIAGFEGRLELSTGDFAAADKFVETVLQSHGLWQAAPAPSSHNGKRLWSFSCRQQSLNLVLADLAKGWSRFDSAILVVNNGEVTVDNVTASQLAEIAGHSDSERRIKAAKYFAITNNMARRLPAEKVLAINDAKPDLVTIPKPVLTSSEQTAKDAGDKTQDQQNVQLTIVLVGSK